MAHILALADAHNLTILIPPESPQSARFFKKFGFVWPDDDLICQETNLLLMWRHPQPVPSPAPAF
ncbi:hypothetical protein [Bosea sp. RAC05]|mgnify:CR=1 FL=1|uniref:hypothetical protein n=1 Tax=Bosea sp. RAC05 TaxID=1842539 RepID=UPI00083DDA55|nr:hypothetical protein [Bosea sp. RAC05]AOG03065.1 hypothetical protein BSY19_5366 [Bosea sp. RAC05]